MPTISTVTAPTLDAIFTKYDTIFQTQYNEIPTQHELITMTTQSNGLSSIYPWLEKVPGLRKLIGERKISSVQLKGYQIYNAPYEETEELRRIDIMTDNYGVFDQRVRIMANNAKIFPDLQVFGDLLPNGFYSTKQAGYNTDGSDCTCYDGQPFFGDHSRAGVSFTNKLTTALSEAEFEKAIIQLYTQLGSVGSAGEAPIMVNPKATLIVGPKMMQVAKRITKAEFGNFGATNINFNFVELVVSSIITDNSWYLVATDNALKPFIWQVLEPIQFTALTSATDLNVFMRQSYLYGSLGYFGWGYTLPELAIGSTGAN